MAVTQIDKEIVTFLKTLGSGPNKIAENLTALKIKGVVGDGNQCPIAKVIRKQFKNLKGLSVTSDLEFTYKGEDYVVAYPSAISKFIEKFDGGAYPALATKQCLADANLFASI
jgi:hypothetical protein